MRKSSMKQSSAESPWRTGIGTVLALVAFLALATPGGATTAGAPRLVVSNSFILLVYYHQHYLELERSASMGPGGLYGYGWLNQAKTEVFVAYQRSTHKVQADIAIIDLPASRITHLDGSVIAAMGGKAYYDVNSRLGEVLFNRPHGVGLLTTDTDKNIYRAYLLNDTPCEVPFWIDDHTGGCRIYDKSGKNAQFVTFPVLSVSELKQEPNAHPVQIKSTTAQWTVDNEWLRLKEIKKKSGARPGS